MTRTRRFVRGIGAGYLNQALVTLVGLWLVRFLLHRLGSEEYGLWLVAGQVLGYMALTDLGVVALLPRETAYATGRAGGGAAAREVGAVFGETARIVLWQMPLVAVAAVVAWLLIPDSWATVRGPLGGILVLFVICFPLRILDATLRGLQDLAYVGLLQTVSWAANTAAVVALVFGGWGLYALVAGWAAGQMVTAIGAYVRLERRFRGAIPRRLPRVTATRALDRVVRGLWVSASSVAHILMSGTDILLIGAMLGPAAAVPYAMTAKLAMVFANQPQLLMEAAQPGLAELRTAEHPGRIARVTGILSELMLTLTGGVACVVLATNRQFVTWWVGAENWAGMILTVAVLARILVSHWNLTLGSTLFALGYERRNAVVAIVNGAVTLGLSIGLIRAIGVIGAPLAVVAGALLVSVPVNLATLARATGTTATGYVAGLWPWGWRFAAGAAAAGAVHLLGLAARPITIAAAAAGGGVLYFGLMLQRIGQSELVPYLHPAVARVLGRLRLSTAGPVT
jgi:O-antigen/teichoic acid export membrane protein